MSPTAAQLGRETQTEHQAAQICVLTAHQRPEACVLAGVDSTGLSGFTPPVFLANVEDMPTAATKNRG